MLNLQIVTPQGITYEDKSIDMVLLPTVEGVIGVAQDHAPLVSIIVPGEIEIKKTNHSVFLAVSGGILEVRRNSKVYVLADTAERAEHIDLQRAEEARKRAEEFLKQKQDIADIEFASIQAQIEKEIARIKVAKKYKKL